MGGFHNGGEGGCCGFHQGGDCTGTSTSTGGVGAGTFPGSAVRRVPFIAADGSLNHDSGFEYDTALDALGIGVSNPGGVGKLEVHDDLDGIIAAIGHAKLGSVGAAVDEAWLGHYDRFTAAAVGFKQTAAGASKVNATAGQAIALAIGDVSKWQVDANGHLIAVTDNTVDIGADGATRPRNVRAAGLVLAGNGTVGAPSIGFDSDEDNGLYLEATNSVGIASAGAGRWKVNASGHLLAVTDASFDIGASGANRPRVLYTSSNAIIGATIQFGSLLGTLQTRGSPNRAGIETASANYAYLTGNLAAGATADADVILAAAATRTAGFLVAMGNAAPNGILGTRKWGLKFDGRTFVGVLNSAPTDADLQASEVSWYLDEATNTLKARVKYADGTTLKTGSVALV